MQTVLPRKFLSLLLVFFLVIVQAVYPVAASQEATDSAQAIQSPEPTQEPTTSPSPAPSPTQTPTLETTPTPTPTDVPTPTPTPQPEATLTVTEAPTQLPTPSPELTPTPTPTPTVAQVAGVRGDFVEGEVIVKFKEREIDLDNPVGKVEAALFEEKNDLEKKDEIEDLNIQVLASQDKTTEQIIAELADDPEVEKVEPNWIIRLSVIPNDAGFSNLWGLHNTGQIVHGTPGTNDADIDAPEAWNLESSAQQDVIVAVIDSGVLYTHTDLAANMWDGSSCRNENGISISGGCPNHGWDFVGDTGDNDPTDDNGHGTHVAGTIAAVSDNGVGISGVSMRNNLKIMALKAFAADGSATTSDIITAINFARQNGAAVINASFGSYQGSSLLQDALSNFSGLIVAAAGNDGNDNDASGHFPCSFNLANIICVAATDQNDELALFSNYGVSSVDVGAPGVNIYSTCPDFAENCVDGYRFLEGTSMATPHVAGVGALVLSSNPNLTAAQIKVIILDSGDSTEALFGNTVTGKRINAFTALNQAGEGAPNIVINEFVSNASEEWIELFNPTGSPVNLTGWKLKQLTNPSTAPTEALFANLSGTIEPQGFLVFTAAGLLNNTGDWIGLYNNEEVPVRVDQLSFGNVASPYSQNVVNNPGVNQSTGRTVDGGENFQTFGSPTPGISNGSQFNTVYVDDDWTDSGNDGGYFWGLNAFSTIGEGMNTVGLGGTVNVAAGDYYESLSIEQSVTLIGAGAGESTIFDNDCGSGVVNIYASNVAVKNFTLDDDECGASVVYLGSEVTDVTIQNNEIINGYEGIEISTDTDSIVISNNTIYNHEDFGIWMNGIANSTIQSNEIYNNDSGGIRLDDGDFGGTTFSQNNIHDNYGYGIFSSRSSVEFTPLTISENTILNNAYDGISFRYVPDGATLDILSNTIEGNGSDGGGGIYVNRLTDSNLSIIENTIRNNSSEGVRVNTVSNSSLTLSGNTITNNSSTGIYLSGGGNSVDNSDVAISNNTISTNQSDGIYVDVITASTFDISNNTIDSNDGNGVYICAQGECTDSTITISGNTISGSDSNGLYLYNILASTVAIDDNDIVSNSETGIYMQYIGASAPSDPSTVTLADNAVSGNSSYGVYLGSVDEVSRVEIGSGNTVSANSSSGIYLDSNVTGVVITGNTIENNSPESEGTGLVVLSATGNEAHQNVISGNGVGVENQDGDEEDFFDATENYWGHASGPRHDDLNPDGLGDQISDTVLFSPFYEDQQRSILSELEFSTNDIASFVEHGIFDLPDDEEGQELVEFVTLLQQVAFKPPEGGGDNVVLPDGVRIERTDDQEFDWDSLSLQTVIEENLSGFSSDDIVEEAIQWGLANIELEFSQPITIGIFVGTALNGQTLNVKRSTSGSSGWTNSGIVAPATCVISSGLCSFQATKASFFAATSTPAPTPTPAQAAAVSSTSPLGAASSPACNDAKPGSAPTLLGATSVGANSVSLTWSAAADPVTYYLVTYGLSKGAQQYGNPNVGGKDATSYTVSGLSGATTYYFRVRAGNGCAPGDFSNELFAAVFGETREGPAEGFQEGILGGKEEGAEAGGQEEKAAGASEEVQRAIPKLTKDNLLPVVLFVIVGFAGLAFASYWIRRRK